VCFDLLSALLDSWTVWDGVAEVMGAKQLGRPWRRRYLERTAAAGRYVPYLDIVSAAATDVGLPRESASMLEARWDSLPPWPDVMPGLAAVTVPKGVVTNCSEALGRRAVTRVGAPFNVVVTAERAGAYKPASDPYQLTASELGVGPEDIAYVAGSAFDALGAERFGFRVAWVNRLGDPRPRGFQGAILYSLRTWFPAFT
jgi:2-haloalkanoic acid dehalogenase type II